MKFKIFNSLDLEEKLIVYKNFQIDKMKEPILYDFLLFSKHFYHAICTADLQIKMVVLKDMPYTMQEKCWEVAQKDGCQDSEGFLGFKKMFDFSFFNPFDYSIVEC